MENYALKDRKKEELDLLERVKMLRRIELSAQKTRNQLIAEQMRKDNVGQLVSKHATNWVFKAIILIFVF